jgi:DnaJ like chaperone protein
MSKWLFAFIGYSFFKFPGAIVGYFLGTIIKNISSNKFKKSKFNSIRVKFISSRIFSN